MYFATILSERWPVCFMIAREDFPALAAAVARPALRLWPARCSASIPTAWPSAT